MRLFSRVNRFIEERLNIKSYPIKVVLLFTLLIFISMFLAFLIDVTHSVKEVRSEIELAAERAAMFRTTAIRNVILEIFKADLSLLSFLEKDRNVLTPLLGSFLECYGSKGFLKGRVERSRAEEALRSSGNKKLYFYLFPEDWLGIAVIKQGDRSFFFCHRVPQIESILSKRLGAIAKYGAEFYFGKKPDVGEEDILVTYENNYSNASMYVVVPYRNIISTLVGERVLLYFRLYLTFILFLAVSYLLWAKLITYPIRRLRETVSELERGNYDVDFSDMLEAKDEFGSIARLLKSFAEETRTRLDKLELILDTALTSPDSSEEVEDFVKEVLYRVDSIFGSRTSLLIVEDTERGSPLYWVSSEEKATDELLSVYSKNKDRFPEGSDEPICLREEFEGRRYTTALFRVDESTVGGVVLSLEKELDPINESYLKVICQHLFSTVKLTHLATTDPLTRIANRRMLWHDLERYGRIARRYGKNLSLIMLDIDNFKGINDTYGHVVGDEVLKKIASVLKTSVRESDTLYRYGGEEFAILCPETDKRGAYELAERIRNKVKKTSVELQGDGLIYVTVSLGVASFPDDTDDPQELLSVADISLYKAKREGKDKTAVLEGREDRESFLERFRKERELKGFIMNDSIAYELQPVYDLKRDTVFGYELLFRVVDEGRLYPMGAYIRYIEDMSLIEEIDRRTVKEVIQLLQRKDLQYCFLLINISPRSLDRGSIFTELSKVPKHQRASVFVEITEREDFLNMEKALSSIRELKDMGFGIVIDDFGSGYSSISQMRRFVKYINLIKLDGSFVKNAHRDPYNRAILMGIKVLTEKLGIDLIAEFIEKEEDLRVVKELGVRFGQGFYFRNKTIA